MRLAELADAAAHHHGVLRVSDNTYRRTYLPVCRRLRRFFGDVSLDDLSPAHLARWCRSLEESELAIDSANSYKSTAKAMLNRVGYGHLAEHVKMLPTPVHRQKAMRTEHFRRICRYANPRDLAILLLLRHSGRRRATVCRLRVEECKIWQGPEGDFRFASRSVEKGQKPVLVYAKHRAALAILQWMELRPVSESPWLFTRLNGGEPLKPDRVTAIFHKLKTAAGIPGAVQISPHTLRHKFAQDMLEEFDARIVADWMGITVDTLLQVYAARNEEELQRLYFGDGSG